MADQSGLVAGDPSKQWAAWLMLSHEAFPVSIWLI